MICISLMQLCQVSHAQMLTPASRLKKVYEAYLENENLFLDIEVTGYHFNQETIPILLGKGKIRRKGNLYYSCYDDTESITTEKVTTVVNHARKTISIFQAEKPLKERYNDSQIPNFDAIIDKLEDISVEVLSNGNTRYTFISQFDQIYKTEIEISRQTNLICEIVYHYMRPGNESDFEFKKVVAVYKTAKEDKSIDQYFNINKFVTHSSNGYQLTTPFSRYSLSSPDPQNRLSP